MGIRRFLFTYDDVSRVKAITERDQFFSLQSKQLPLPGPTEMARFMPWRPDGGPLMQRFNRIDRRQVQIAITQGENRTIKFRDHTQKLSGK